LPVSLGGLVVIVIASGPKVKERKNEGKGGRKERWEPHYFLTNLKTIKLYLPQYLQMCILIILI
jgi:hypothetical protein